MTSSVSAGTCRREPAYHPLQDGCRVGMTSKQRWRESCRSVKLTWPSHVPPSSSLGAKGMLSNDCSRAGDPADTCRTDGQSVVPFATWLTGRVTGGWPHTWLALGRLQAELGAFDNQERALANILWRATWGHGMRPCFLRLPMSLYSTVVRSVVHGPIRDRSQRWLRGSVQRFEG